MKFILFFVFLITISSAWAQSVSQSDIKVDVSDGLSTHEQGVNVLPITVDITHVLSPGEFQALSLSNLRAGLFKLTLDLFENDKNYASVSGTIFNLRQRKVFLRDQDSQTFRGLELIQQLGFQVGHVTTLI